MTTPFRVIDTGLRSGRANIAFDQALIDGRLADAIPDTIRFLRFPPTALVGRHQDLGREIKLAHCAANGIGVARRITGGGAIYFDEGQLGWELVFKRAHLGIGDLGTAAKRICEAAAAGLSQLGVDARYRPRNDIEVDGRKICGTGGFFEGDVLFYQGTLLIDMNPQDMVAALNVPKAKLEKRALDDAAQRVTTLRALMGDDLPDLATIQAAMLAGFRDGLGIATEAGAVDAAEEGRAQDIHDTEIGTDDFVHAIDGLHDATGTLSATHTGAGGTVTAFVRLEGPTSARIREVLITGDFFVTPPRVIFDLEAALRGVDRAGVGDAVDAFFARTAVDALTLAPTDIRDVLVEAVAA
ncbi:MAG: lipoate--protein ligase family protein [Rhodospirillaceae bacterium]